MTQIEGKISMHLVSVLIDPGACHSYISPIIIEKCKLQKDKSPKPWLVQLAIGTKIKILESIKGCPLKLNGLETSAYLNILPLGSYDFLIGMDWSEKLHVILNYLKIIFTRIDDLGNPNLVKGIPKKNFV